MGTATDQVTAPAPAAPERANPAAPDVDVAEVLVADGMPAGPGQLTRAAFLERLDRAVRGAVDEVLLSSGRSTEDCPYLNRYLDRLRLEPVERLTAVIRLWVHPVRDTPDDWMDAIAARAGSAAEAWRDGRADPLVSEVTPTGAADFQESADRSRPHAVLGALGDGQALPGGVRSRAEQAFGVDFSHVRIHVDEATQRIATDNQARAFTVGKHVGFASGEFRPGSLAGDAVLAHELAHVAQQSEIADSGTHASRAEDDADAGAFAMLTGSGLRRSNARTGLRLASCGSLPSADEPDSRVRELAGDQIADVAPTPPPSISAVPAFASPVQPGASLGERLESSDATVRVAAIAQLGAASGPDGWRAALIAMDSAQPDVATAAEQLVVGWLVRPDFRAWMTALPNQGVGQLGDIALRVLARAGQGSQVNLGAYRGLLRQELTLLRAYRREILSQTADPASDRAFNELEVGLSTTDAVALAGVGRRISRLLERFTLVRAEVARTNSVATQQGVDAATQRLAASHRQAMVTAAATITADQDDQSFTAVLEGMRSFTVGLAQATLEQLSTFVEQSRDQLRPIVQAAGQRSSVPRLVALVTPLVTDLDSLAARITAWRAAVQAHPVVVMQNLNSLQSTLADLLNRTRLAREAVSAEATAQAVEAHSPRIDMPRSMDFAGGEGVGMPSPSPPVDWSAGQVQDWRQVIVDLRTHRDNYALLAERYRSNPEATLALEREEAPLVERTGTRLEIYQGIEAARANLAMAELQTNLGVLILILSAWTGGLAGEAAVGLGGTLGIDALIGGRAVIWVGSVVAEGSVFYATQRGLDWAVHGGQGPVFPDTWRRDLALSIGAVGVLKAAGGMFNAIAGARPPTTGLAVGRFATNYAALMAYSNIVEPWVRGESRPGLGTAAFWGNATQTLLMMGAVHAGMSAMRPLTLRITEPIFRARVAAHNVRAERIGVDLEEAFSGQADPANIRSVVRRSRALLLERQGLLQQVAERNLTPDFTSPEFAQLNPLIQTQIQLADSTLVLDTFRVQPLGIGRNTFGYEGSMETVRQHLESRGFRLASQDPATGLLRMTDPAGNEIAFLRMHAGATGADPNRMVPESSLEPAEQNRRAAAAYETIRELTDDVAQVTQHTGVPARVVEAVRQHLFLRVHQIPVGPGRSNVQRFDPMYGLARLWMGAYEGVLRPSELTEFRRLMAHEFVEQGLMAAGMPYRSAHPQAWRGNESHGTAAHYGAHEVAPNEGRSDPYSHRPAFGLPGEGQPQPQSGELWDYDAALRSTFESLAAQTSGPFRVVTDPTAPQGYRVEARDAAEMGVVDPARAGARATGATGAWAGVRTQLIGQGITADEATQLAGLLAAAGRTPSTATPATTLTADQLRQLLPLDPAGLTRVLGIDEQLLPTALSLASSPGDLLGGRALDALIRSLGLPAVVQLLQPDATNRAMFPELSRNALETIAIQRPATAWAEAQSQGQLQVLLDAPGSGFQRFQHPTTGTRIPEPGFRAGVPLNMGRRQAQAAGRLGNATFPDVYGTDAATGQQQAMELKTPRLGDSVASHFRRPEVARGIIDQHGGRLLNLPTGTPSYLVVDIRQTGQNIFEALSDLSTVMRNYGSHGDARGLWNGVRFITGTATNPTLSGVYQIPRP